MDYYESVNKHHRQAALGSDGFYDSRPGLWKHHPVQRWARRSILRHLGPDLRGDESILDVGCGRGDLALLLKRSFPGLRITGVDIVPEMVEIGRRITAGLTDVRFETGNILELPFPPESFDVVVVNNMLHVLLPNDQDRAIAQVAAISRTRILLEIKNGASLYNRLKQKKMDDLVVYPTTTETVSCMLDANGFSVAATDNILGSPLLSPWITVRADRLPAEERGT